jgi:hypothetical protein
MRESGANRVRAIAQDLQSCDAAQFCIHRRGQNDGLARARRDAHAHERHVVAVAERDIARLRRRGLLASGLRLAGQRGLNAP